MASSTDTQSSPLAGARILVVEDEFIIALDIDRTMKGAGAEHLRHAGNLKDALAFLDSVAAGHETVDVAVVDLKLDRDSALPAARRLSDLGIPFVFLTGAPEAGDTRVFPNAPVVAKPFDDASLTAAVAAVLRRGG